MSDNEIALLQAQLRDAHMRGGILQQQITRLTLERAQNEQYAWHLITRITALRLAQLRESDPAMYEALTTPLPLGPAVAKQRRGRENH